MNAKTRRAAIWLRVSTNDQTTENQRADLLRLAEMRGFSVVKEYDLTGVSGASGGAHKYLSNVIADARSATDGFDVLLIWALDRLSREGIQATLGMLQRLTNAGIDIVSHREAEIDTTSPFGELAISTFAIFARLESERISERTRSGLARAKEGGKQLGRPKGSKDKKKRRRRSRAESGGR